MNYYYLENEEAIGPFTLEELRGEKITPDTWIRVQELGDWKPARQVPELRKILSFPAEKPIYDKRGRRVYDESQRPQTYLGESILATIFCFLPFAVVGIFYAIRVNEHFNAGNLAGAQDASNNAKKWVNRSVVVALAVIFLYLMWIISTGSYL